MEKAGKIKLNHGTFIERTPAFSEVYEQFFQEKFYNFFKKLSTSTMNSTRAAFYNCSSIHNIPFGQLKYDDLQDILNKCPLKHSSRELIVSLLHQMYRYALKYEFPFSDADLKILWQNRQDPTVEIQVP